MGFADAVFGTCVSVSFFVAISSSAGCSPVDPETGAVAFRYGGTGCARDCTPADREVLTGSHVTVRASDGRARKSAKVSPAAVARLLGERETCTCYALGEPALSVPLDEACPSDHVKTCTLEVDLATEGAGDATLYVEHDGIVIDATKVRVRDAERIDVAVSSALRPLEADGGAYEIAVGAPLVVVPTFYGAEGWLLATKHAVGVRYDPALLAPNELSQAGGSTTLDLTARAEGACTLSVRAGAVERPVGVRVVARRPEDD